MWRPYFVRDFFWWCRIIYRKWCFRNILAQPNSLTFKSSKKVMHEHWKFQFIISIIISVKHTFTEFFHILFSSIFAFTRASVIEFKYKKFVYNEKTIEAKFCPMIFISSELFNITQNMESNKMKIYYSDELVNFDVYANLCSLNVCIATLKKRFL